MRRLINKNMDKKTKQDLIVRGSMLSAAGAAAVSAASATFNMTASFQPIIDIIGVLTTNSDSWIGLVVLGVEIGIAVAVGVFIKSIMSKSTGHVNK